MLRGLVEVERNIRILKMWTTEHETIHLRSNTGKVRSLGDLAGTGVRADIRYFLTKWLKASPTPFFRVGEESDKRTPQRTSPAADSGKVDVLA